MPDNDMRVHIGCRAIYFHEFCSAIQTAWTKQGFDVTISDSLNQSNADIVLAVGVHLFLDAPLRRGGLLAGIQTEQMSVNGVASGRLLRNRKRFRCVSGYYDMLFDWIPGLATAQNRIFMPYGCPSAPFRNEPRKYDVCFIGNIHGNRREKLLASLSRDFNFFPDFSPGFGESKLHAIRQSRVLLNVKFYENGGFESPRIFDYLAEGAFVISERSPVTTPFVAGKDFIEYHDEEHLRVLLRQYLDDDASRVTIAQQGHATSQQFTWETVAELLLSEMKRRINGRGAAARVTGWGASRVRCGLFTARDAFSNLRRALLGR
jgi:hypothetical protein